MGLESPIPTLTDETLCHWKEALAARPLYLLGTCILCSGRSQGMGKPLSRGREMCWRGMMRSHKAWGEPLLRRVAHAGSGVSAEAVWVGESLISDPGA